MSKQWKMAGACVLCAAALLLQGCAKVSDTDESAAAPAVTTVAAPVESPKATTEATAAGTFVATPVPQTLETATEIAAPSTATSLAPAVVDGSLPQVAADTASVSSLARLTPEEIAAHQGEVDKLCAMIGDKLSSVETKDCLDQLCRFGGGYSINNRPLMFKDYMPDEVADNAFRVLLMGGVHGDEYSSISIIFKWLSLFAPDALEGEFHWRFAPLVNPDGLLDGSQAKRQNANGVDLNRNFPSEDWNATAVQYWQESTGSNPRRFPGNSAASEPEVQWIVDQIIEFQPDVIVSVHAPYHILDFDGPTEAPRNIGELYLHQLGVYPGSLGNYAGLNKSIPVVTRELPSAGIMPKPDQIALMWNDLVGWLDKEGRKKMQD